MGLNGDPRHIEVFFNQEMLIKSVDKIYLSAERAFFRPLLSLVEHNLDIIVVLTNAKSISSLNTCRYSLG